MMTAAKVALLWTVAPLLVWWLSRVPKLWRLAGALALRFSALASKRTLSIVLVGVLCILGRLTLLPLLPHPEPTMQDEFSYLLAADTFASGRLTNAAHPHWISFEAIHELSQPTYQSKYPPMQGLFLAAGQKLAGDPWIGVLLSAAFMCGAVCWMLQGWVSPGWALLGALFAMLQFGIFRYWTNTYWGGAVAAFGGAVVLGAVARLLWPERSRLPSPANGAILAAGITVLANSRPFEGLLFCISLTFALACAYSRMARRLFSANVILPAGIVLSIGAACMGYYNFRVTGNALQLPYALYERQYAAAGAFLFQPLLPAHGYNHKELKDFWTNWDVEVLRVHEAEPVLFWIVQMAQLPLFFLGIGPQLLILPACAWLCRVREIRFTVMTVVVFFLPLFFAKAFPPHYVAPMTGVFLLAITLTLQRLWSVQGITGPILVGSLLCAAGIEFAIAAILPPPDFVLHQSEFQAKRSVILSALERTPGEHLIFVQYSTAHNVREGWIYNAADIDRARIIWAHDMGPRENRELTDYYPGRSFWRLQPDVANPHLVPYP